MNKKIKLTRQGVRDLNHLPSRPSGVRLTVQPNPPECWHRDVESYGEGNYTYVTRKNCNESWYETLNEPWYE